MEIYSKAGSKERMLEMMQGVNKIKLNEFRDSFNGTNLGSNFNEEPPAEQPKQYSGKFQDLEIDEDVMKTIDSLPSEEPDFGKMGMKYGKDLGDGKYGVDMDSEESKPDSDDFDMSGENTQEPEQSPDDALHGGIADNVSGTEFNGEQIRKGLKVEMEHTDDPMIALDIVYDHLTEDPMYYGDENQDPEQSAQIGAEKDANTITGDEFSKVNGEDNPSGCWNDTLMAKMMGDNQGDEEETDILLGFKPVNVGDEMRENSPIESKLEIQQESPDDYFSDEKKTMNITPITTKRDRGGFKYYKSNDNSNEVWGEKDGTLYNTNEYGEPTSQLRMSQVNVNGIIPDNNDNGFGTENRELGIIRRNMGLGEI